MVTTLEKSGLLGIKTEAFGADPRPAKPRRAKVVSEAAVAKLIENKETKRETGKGSHQFYRQQEVDLGAGVVRTRRRQHIKMS